MSYRIHTSMLCCGRKILKTMWNNFTQIQGLFISIHNVMLVQYICHIKSNLVYFWSYFIKSVPCRYTLRSPLVLVGFLSLNLLLCGLVYISSHPFLFFWFGQIFISLQNLITSLASSIYQVTWMTFSKRKGSRELNTWGVFNNLDLMQVHLSSILTD